MPSAISITIIRVPIAVHWEIILDFLLRIGMKKADLGKSTEQTARNFIKKIHLVAAGLTLNSYIAFVSYFMSRVDSLWDVPIASTNPEA